MIVLLAHLDYLCHVWSQNVKKYKKIDVSYCVKKLLICKKDEQVK